MNSSLRLFGATSVLSLLLGTVPRGAYAASPYIDIRISVKVIDYGGAHNTDTRADFDAMLVQANQFMANRGRGYRFVDAGFQIITPNVPPPARYFSQADGSPVPAPSPGQPDPPNTFKVQPVNLYKFWNSTHSGEGDGCWLPPDDLVANDGTKISQFSVLVDDIFKTAIRDNKTAFKYETVNANLYVIWNNYCGGEGTFPGTSHEDTNIYHVSSLNDIATFIHEFGHFVDLPHPFDTNTYDVDGIGTENPDYPDTPPDCNDPYSRLTVADAPSSPANGDALANRMYGHAYSALANDGQKKEVRIMDKVAQLRGYTGTYLAATINELWVTWENIMSYHKGQDPVMDNWLWTEQQVDHTTDIMNNVRSPITSGRSWFTASSGIDVANSPNGSNSPPYSNPESPGQRYGFPYSLSLSVSSANSAGGDIVLLRPADTFPNPVTINRPVTLRVSHGGHATIGSSTPH